MMWSRTFIPICSPASISRFVALMSSWLGCGSPLGWLCRRITEFAASSIANLNISRGWNTLALSVPSKMVASAITLPHFTLGCKFARCACRRHAPFGVQSKHNSDFFREDTAFLTSSGRQRPQARCDFLLLCVKPSKSLAEFKRRDDFL